MRKTHLVSAAVLAASMACSDSKAPPSGLTLLPPGAIRANVGGFGCAITYYAITQTNEAELAAFGVEPLTDTAQVCETWTGGDYQVEVTQIGSSEPVSDFSENVKTVIYQNGATSAYNASGSLMASQADVGVTSFEFVAATPDETQASYSDPYYGVIQNSQNCTPSPGAPTCPVFLRQLDQSQGVAQASLDRPLSRAVLKHLLKGKQEITPSIEGYRRFHKVEANGDETTISIDPVTELIRRRESKTGKGITRSDLTWTEQRGKFVRDRLDMVSDEVVRGKRMLSRTSVVLRNVQWDPALVK